MKDPIGFVFSWHALPPSHTGRHFFLSFHITSPMNSFLYHRLQQLRKIHPSTFSPKMSPSIEVKEVLRNPLATGSSIGEIYLRTADHKRGRWKWSKRMAIPCDKVDRKDRISKRDLRRIARAGKQKLNMPHKIQPSVTLRLAKGGTVKVWRNLIRKTARQHVAQEMMERLEFKQYTVQSYNEPRVHLLLHENDCKSGSPYYRYGSTTLRASPVSHHKNIHAFSEAMKQVAGVDKWGIGLNPIVYRSNSDYIGKHSDNAQGETTIMTAILAQESERALVIEPKVDKKQSKRALQGTSDQGCVGAEKIRLILKEGDVYCMDGEMQENYVHSLPKMNTGKNDDSDSPKRRFVIVFRDGQFLTDDRVDRGKPVPNLEPPPKLNLTFGEIPKLDYNKVYTRKELYESGGHAQAQKSVYGNQKDGCAALIVSGKFDTNISVWDAYAVFIYVVNDLSGAQALSRSFHLNRSIRVFRSSAVDHTIQALPSGRSNRTVSLSYRPDGLYKVLRLRQIGRREYAFMLAMENLDTNGRNLRGNLPPLFAPDWSWNPDRSPLHPKWKQGISRRTFEQIFCRASASSDILGEVRASIFSIPGTDVGAVTNE